jgi:succinyl-CoA synthetase beta subunit
MKLPEYKAKELFEKYGMPTMNGTVIDSLDGIEKKLSDANLSFPVVGKAQVQVGGRGKAGGIKFANDIKETKSICEGLLFSDLKGFRVNQLLIVEKAQPEKEWYLSIMLDRATKMPLIIFSAAGGMEIEEVAKVAPEKIIKVNINPYYGVQDYIITYMTDKSGIGAEYASQLKDVVIKLYNVFKGYSCLLAEINPLAVDKSGKVIALDGKVDIDDSALYRLPDMVEFKKSLPEDPLVIEAESFNFLYIPIEKGGNIAVMSNGSGMVMSCIDLISKKGMTVGAALDLGGGATAERIKEAVRIVLSNKDIDTLFISIFGGITRCDEVAGGIKMAMEKQDAGKTVIVRMEGTNKKEGIGIIESINSDNIVSVAGIPEGVAALYERKARK